MNEKSDFDPKILAFTCNWCSYAGADLAGVSRFQYPPNVRLIKVMCSGRITPSMLLHAFKSGVDGVLFTGCHIGDCHYISGNKSAEKVYGLTSKLMKALGIDPRRLRQEWVSAAEGERFAGIVTEFTNAMRELGPSPIRPAKGIAE